MSRKPKRSMLPPSSNITLTATSWRHSSLINKRQNMRKRVFLALVCAAGFSALASKKADDARQFLQQIPKNDRIAQALNRLTFGPRPGDAELVHAVGLKKWIDQQLHSERIPENPVLLEKLKFMDTLTMSSEEVVRNYRKTQMT